MQALEDLLDESGRFLALKGYEAAEHSKAAQELSAFPDREFVETAFSQGEQLMQVASEQVICFIRACAEPALTIATWSSVRAVIESCSLASWLLTPSIDVITRIKRSFAFRYEGIDQQAKFARATNNQITLDANLRRIDTLEQQAVSLGFKKVVDKNGKRIGIGQKMPPITALAGDAIGEEKAYRLLSAVTHAHPWAVQQVSYEILSGAAASGDFKIPVGYTGSFLKKAAKPICLQYLALKASKAFTGVVVDKSVLFGWDNGEFGPMIQSHRERIGNLANALEVKFDPEEGG